MGFYSPHPRISARPADTFQAGEVEQLAAAAADLGSTTRRRLYEAVGARHWGPGRFRRALRVAVASGRLRRTGRDAYGPGA